MNVTARTLLILATLFFAQRSQAKTIGPGVVTLKGLISAPDSIKFAPNTTIHIDGASLFIKAPTIQWGENVVFDVNGADGADGRNIPPEERVGWCMAKDHNNWEQEWNNATPPAGKRGGNGLPGESGRDIEIEARQHTFASAAARITFRASGGHGGRAGKGGLGARYTLKPSGADCDHGTNEQANKEGPPGQDGSAGSNGDNGHIVFRSATAVDLNRVKVDGGTLIWLVPGLAIEAHTSSDVHSH